MTKKVESNITKTLLKTFWIVVDGCTVLNSRFIPVYAILLTNTEYGFRRVLLAFSLLEVEMKQDAQEHLEFLKFVLDTFSWSFSSVAALQGNNYVINLALRKVRKVSIEVCTPHKFNFAMNEINSLTKGS